MGQLFILMTGKVKKNFSVGGNYLHGFVTHKYFFVNPENDVHNQHVASFNNKLKGKVNLLIM